MKDIVIQKEVTPGGSPDGELNAWKAAVVKLIYEYCVRKKINPRDTLKIVQHNGWIWGELEAAKLIRPGMTREKFVRELCDKVWEIHCGNFRIAQETKGQFVISEKQYEENVRGRIEAIAQIEDNRPTELMRKRKRRRWGIGY